MLRRACAGTTTSCKCFELALLRIYIITVKDKNTTLKANTALYLPMISWYAGLSPWM